MPHKKECCSFKYAYRPADLYDGEPTRGRHPIGAVHALDAFAAARVERRRRSRRGRTRPIYDNARVCQHRVAKWRALHAGVAF